MVCLRFFTILALLAGAGLCQKAAPRPVFEVAEVHVSPRSEWVKSPQQPMQGGYLAGDRYELHRATMLDLIRIAYNVDAAKISGGPSWLDYDRFEVVAKTKPGTRAETLRLMLQTLLEDRFRLEVKADTRPAQAYLLTKSKGELKLRAADSAVLSACQPLFPPERSGATVIETTQCRNVTMDAFAQIIRPRLSNPTRSIPVVNMTGIDGGWDMDLRMARTPGGDGPNETFSEALEKIGLKAELGTAPQPVMVVEHVNEQASADPPGVAESLPPLPSPEFEVASLKLCIGGKASIAPRFEAGGRVTATCMPTMSLVQQAWNLRLLIGENPPGTPKSLMGGGWVTIIAKAPAGVAPDPAYSGNARDILNAMLRVLLIDRYSMKVHYEERTVDAPTLVAAKPKLTKADPKGRTGCARETDQGPGPFVVTRDTRLIVKLMCTNMTMAQFAEQMEQYDSQLAYPVMDATGIEGAWDFTINYDPISGALARLPLLAGRGGNTADGQASEPSGGLSLADALSKQLGLKLEMHKRPEQVFVIDHMEEMPAEN
jgi:uncharacterized protein (TIGR03435 family)